MKRTSEAGMTLIEVVVAVAIVGILAKLVIPAFMSQTRKAEGDTEVATFFAELTTKEEQYKVDHGVYLATGASETATWPATPSASLQNITPIPATWTSLRVITPTSQARCAYVVIAGTASTGTVGSIASTSFAFTKPAMSWYYVLAHCNLDNNAAKDSYYFSSSTDAKIKTINYGN